MSWELLRELREDGQRPASRVVVTTSRAVAERKRGDGSLVILHRAGQPMRVELLHGLDVGFVFDRCELAGRVYRLMADRDVRPASVQTWCHCAQAATAAAFSCAEIDRLTDWSAEGAHAAA